MRNRKKLARKRIPRARRGAAALEAVASIVVTVLPAALLFYIAVVGCRNLYHVISNVRITFPKPNEALHQSYWQTVYRDAEGRMTAAAMGRSADRLVKRDGKWLIQSRKLTVFTD